MLSKVLYELQNLCYNKNMEKLTFNKFNDYRKAFLSENKNLDHVIIEGANNILISAPHGVQQVRLGKYKAPEIGALATALFLQNQTNSFLIAKTKCNNDDVNFDDNSAYKENIKKLIKKHNIKYILDFHGLASFRDCDINLGIHLGENIKNNVELFNSLNGLLEKNGFKVSIDQPFMAGAKTISGSMANEFKDIWTIQIEINCNISNKKNYFASNKKLLQTLTHWIQSIH